MIGGCVQRLRERHAAVVDDYLMTDFEAQPALELAGLLTDLQKQRQRLEAVEARALAALSAQATPAQFGATSVPDLVGGLTRVTRGEAKARAQRSVDVTPRRTLQGELLPPIHPRTAAALEAGEISGAHVDVITRYLGRLPAVVANESLCDPDRSAPRTVFDLAEAFLVHAARHEDPGALRRSADLLLARLDPDGAEPRDAELDRQRGFGIGGRGGPNAVWGHWTPETKAVWQAILDSLAAPQPGADGEPDPRTATQRNHDAMYEAGIRLLNSATLPATGGVPVSLIISIDQPDLAQASRGEPGAVARTAHGDIVRAERFLRLAGDAQITTVALTTSGGILDYGRTRRLACPEQRRALIARDGGCCFPGCTRPSAWTEVHHIRAWIRDGLTNLDNLCLLCAHHHRSFEAAGWVVTMTDGIPQQTPPAWLDPSRRPRRNTAHHLPEITFATVG